MTIRIALLTLRRNCRVAHNFGGYTARLRLAWLRFELRDAERYLRICEREGLFSERVLRTYRFHAQMLRVRIAILEAAHV